MRGRSHVSRNDDEAIGYATGYAVSRIETWIDQLAAQSGGRLLAPELAARVGAVLLAQANGAGGDLRFKHTLPAVRRAARSRRQAVGTMAVAGGAYRRAPEGKAAVKRAQRSYRWVMTPARRRAMRANIKKAQAARHKRQQD